MHEQQSIPGTRPHSDTGELSLVLYWRLIRASIRSQMQYKTSFVLEMFSFMALTGLEFVAMAIIVTRFGNIAGWTLHELALLYGLGAMSFGIAEMAGRGFDRPFEIMIQRGTFDMLLIRPRGAFFQVLSSEFQLRRLGRVLEGAVLLAWSLSSATIDWSVSKVLILPVAIASGAVVYTALIVVGATICFWTIKTPEVMNAFTNGGKELTSYPMSIYDGWIRSVFLFLIPVAFTNYPAALLILDRSDPFGLPAAVAWLAPVVAAMAMVAALAFWRVGLRKYASAGS